MKKKKQNVAKRNLPKTMLRKMIPEALPMMSERDVISIKALNRGDADKDLQKHAIEFIIMKLCDVGGFPYYEDSERNSNVSQGKRLIGIQLASIIKQPLESLAIKKKPMGGNN